MMIQITDALIEYLQLNHGGQHCRKYWVLSRCIVAIKNNEYQIEIDNLEWEVIPDKFLI